MAGHASIETRLKCIPPADIETGSSSLINMWISRAYFLTPMNPIVSR